MVSCKTVNILMHKAKFLNSKKVTKFAEKGSQSRSMGRGDLFTNLYFFVELWRASLYPPATHRRPTGCIRNISQAFICNFVEIPNIAKYIKRYKLQTYIALVASKARNSRLVDATKAW
jgi:hypothetical protein